MADYRFSHLSVRVPSCRFTLQWGLFHSRCNFRPTCTENWTATPSIWELGAFEPIFGTVRVLNCYGGWRSKVGARSATAA